MRGSWQNQSRFWMGMGAAIEVDQIADLSGLVILISSRARGVELGFPGVRRRNETEWRWWDRMGSEDFLTNMFLFLVILFSRGVSPIFEQASFRDGLPDLFGICYTGNPTVPHGTNKVLLQMGCWYWIDWVGFWPPFVSVNISLFAMGYPNSNGLTS